MGNIGHRLSIAHIVATAICLFASLSITHARVIRVPEDAPRVQAGLDSLLPQDTLFVALGTYEEFLIAPAMPFTMLGETDSLSGEWTGPFINSSNIEIPDSAAVLHLMRFSRAVIENFRFQNGDRDCIRSWASGVAMRNCIVDSAHYGLNQKQDSIGAVVELIDCQFRAISFTGVIVRAGNILIANRCHFTGAGDELRALVSVSKSEIDSCVFLSNGGDRLLTAVRGPHVVSNCTFGPAVVRPFQTAVSIGDSMPIFTNNTIIDCVYGNHAVRIGAVLPDSARILNNTFVRCRGLNVGLMAAGALGILYTTPPNGQGAHIAENTFIDCAGFVTADDIWPFVSNPALIENNRFVHDGINGLPSIGGSGGPWQPMPHTMRNNVFEDCGYSLDGSASTDARFNYWGHASGPYHETENPNGLGDTITGPVQFVPWLTDTTSSVPHFVELPNNIHVLGYPNPFNSSVTIEYALTLEQNVQLEIYDVLGRQVEMILNERQGIGVHEVLWKADEFASGLYFARLSSDEGAAQAVKLMLLK